MWRWLWSLVVLVGFGPNNWYASSSPPTGPPTTWIVELCDESARDAVSEAVLAKTGKVKHVRHLSKLPALIVSGAEAGAAVKTVEKKDGVCGTHISRRTRIHDPGHTHREAPMSEIKPAGSWWHLDRINQDAPPLDGDATIAHDGSGANVFVLDTGLDASHDEFVASSEREVKNVASYVEGETWEYWPEKGWHDAPGDPRELVANDRQGHGTFTSGTAAGATLGAAPGANVYQMKVLDDTGWGDNSWSLYAMDRVASLVSDGKIEGPTVISASFGDKCQSGSVDFCKYQDPQSKAVESLADLGVQVVVSAGNDSDDGCFYLPQAASRAVSVGAADVNDRVAPWSDYGSCVDIVAPGVDLPLAKSKLAYEQIVDAVPAAPDEEDSAPVPPELELISVASGTSFAAPLVAGAVAVYAGALQIDTVDAAELLLADANSGLLAHPHELECPQSNDRFLRVPAAYESRWFDRDIETTADQFDFHGLCPDPPDRPDWPPQAQPKANFLHLSEFDDHGRVSPDRVRHIVIAALLMVPIAGGIALNGARRRYATA